MCDGLGSQLENSSKEAPCINNLKNLRSLPCMSTLAREQHHADVRDRHMDEEVENAETEEEPSVGEVGN